VLGVELLLVAAMLFVTLAVTAGNPTSIVFIGPPLVAIAVLMVPAPLPRVSWARLALVSVFAFLHIARFFLPVATPLG
jgi:hypothetical protein